MKTSGGGRKGTSKMGVKKNVRLKRKVRYDPPKVNILRVWGGNV